ncbi:MAG TPA: hypothetical protein VNQ90_18025 [Chthoniobacteraceae bacterium]|nr:hypothetical protein [Chthoniobacteraceae bacterium]
MGTFIVCLLISLLIAGYVYFNLFSRDGYDDDPTEKLLKPQRQTKEREASRGAIARDIISRQSKPGRIHIKSLGVFLGTFGKDLSSSLSKIGLPSGPVSFEYGCFRISVATIWLLNKNISVEIYKKQYIEMLSTLLDISSEHLPISRDSLNEISKQRIRFYRDVLTSGGNPASVIQHHLCRIALSSSSRGHPEICDTEVTEFHDALKVFSLFSVISQFDQKYMEASFSAMEELLEEVSTP